MRPTGPRGKRLRQTRFTVAANLPANTVEVRATPEAAEVRASPDLVEEVTVDAEDDDGAAVAEETMKQLLSDDQEGEAELEGMFSTNRDSNQTLISHRRRGTGRGHRYESIYSCCRCCIAGIGTW